MLSTIKSKVVGNKKKKVDILGNLPTEIVQNICLYLTPKDVIEVWNSNPKWMYRIRNDYFWKRKCQLDNVCPREEMKKSEVFKKLNDRFDYWQSAYYYDYALKNNWKNNNYEEITVEGTSSLFYIYLHYFDEEAIIISAIPPDKLYVVSPLTGTVVKTFPLDTGSRTGRKFIIRKFDDKLIMFARYVVMLWNFHTSELLMTKRFDEKMTIEKIRIHKNLVGYLSQVPPSRFYILNMDTQEIKLVAYDIRRFYLYENLGFLLTHNGLIKFFNADNADLVNHSCPKNHFVAGMLLKENHLIIMCEKWHVTTWTIDHINQSLTILVSFSILGCMGSHGNYRKLYKLMLLDDNKFGYQIDQYSKFYVWDFTKGMYFFTMDIIKAFLEKKIGNQLFLLSQYYVKLPTCSGCQVWCLKTGKLMSHFDLITTPNLTVNRIIHFTATQVLFINSTGSLVIRDFEKRIKTNP